MSQLQRITLFLSVLLLGIVLFLARGGINSRAPLEELARKSLDPEIALSNGRPTVLEFYADWCEACREMAPAMHSIEDQFKEDLNIVLLNVDNNRWNDFVEKYSVTGIPQLNFFDKNGVLSGSSIGLKRYEEVRPIINSLLNDEKLPSLMVDGKVSNLQNSLPI